MTQTYPDGPGYKERSGTSEAAAIRMAGGARTLRERVLFTLANRQLTADECARYLGASILAVRPRLSELRRMGLICKTDKTRMNESGIQAAVWTATRNQADRPF
jgi:DNA-binding transcriptional ArsR family regulator